MEEEDREDLPSFLHDVDTVVVRVDQQDSRQEFVEAGKIRSWGVSDFDEEELAEPIAVAGPDTGGPF